MLEEEKGLHVSHHFRVQPAVRGANHGPGVWQIKHIHLTLSSISSIVEPNGQSSSLTQGTSLFTHIQER